MKLENYFQLLAIVFIGLGFFDRTFTFSYLAIVCSTFAYLQTIQRKIFSLSDEVAKLRDQIELQRLPHRR